MRRRSGLSKGGEQVPGIIGIVVVVIIVIVVLLLLGVL